MTGGQVWTFIMRGLRIDLSYRLSFVGRYVGQLVYLLFLYFLGQVVQSGSPALLEHYGDRYFTFLLVGGVFSQYLTTGMRLLPLAVRDEVLVGSLESILVTPVPTTLALLGPTLWAQIEATIALGGYLLIGGGLMGADFSHANWGATIVITALSYVCLLAWGILSVAFVVVFKRTDPVNWLIGVTISFFSGVYFPIAILPIWLRAFSYLLPLTYSLDLLRATLLDGTPLGELGVSLWILLLFTIVSVPLSLLVLDRSVKRAKQTGTLAHY